MIRDKFPNLSAELARIGMSKPQLAKRANMSMSSLYNKCKGKNDWTLSDMTSIRLLLEELGGQELTIDYLFKKEN